MEHIVEQRLYERRKIEKYVWPAVRKMRQKLVDRWGWPVDADSEEYVIPAGNRPNRSALYSSKLCGPCNRITMPALESENGYVHSQDVLDVLRTAQSCPLCKMIRNRICMAVRYHVQHPVKITDPLEALRLFVAQMAKDDLVAAYPMPVVLKVDHTQDSSLNKLIVLGTIMAKPSGNDTSKYKIANVQYWGRLQLHGGGDHQQLPLMPRGSEEEALKRLRIWLMEREKEIPTWSNMASEKRLPTRLLDLDPGGRDGSGNNRLGDTIILRETAGSLGKFVALSYCWGGYKGCRTLKENYLSRLRGIEVNSLPRVFAQAVRVSRGLGIKYLWIDALCIIQDDEEDWKKEAASMSAVYSNTACRLAVTDSENPTVGFFPPEDSLASVQLPNCHFADDAEKDESDAILSTLTSASASSPNLPQWTSINSKTMREMQYKLMASQQFPRVLLEGRDEISKPGAIEGANELMEDIMSMMQEDAASNLNGGNRKDGNSKSAYSSAEAREATLDSALTADGAYISIPRAYTLEVDRGVLNSRAWVLQERLLAPRTIHFTSDHIYCEDSDDICGEDWVRRYFTWLSCIDKTSVLSRINLLPEEGFSFSCRERGDPESNGVWTLRSMNASSETHDVPDPWLRICEKYSRCRLSFEKDRLAAFAGLVEKKAGNPAERSLLGLWQRNLHNELMWYAAGDVRMRWLKCLNLPSWAWIAYEGKIGFVKDGRTRHDAKTVRTPPSCEFVLKKCDVPELMTTLPLLPPASLTIRSRVRKINGFSGHAAEGWSENRSRKDIAATSPFHFDPRTGTVPMALSSGSKCREVYGEDKILIGFVSFDEAVPIAKQELICVHISTLRDEALQDAQRKLDEPGIHTVNLEQYREPILAYTLVLIRVEKEQGGDSYRRVGVAEINYEWLQKGTVSTIKIL